MDHYEVRKYPGWHHHLLLSMWVCPTFYTVF